MAENLSKVPSKSILKNSSSFDAPDSTVPSNRRLTKGAKWDEMNIMATLHPPDKDYGHMKIDEPKTPYNFEGLDGQEAEALDANALAAKIREVGHDMPKAMQEQDSDEDDETPEEWASRKDFESKRKKHYNEFHAVKLARKLLEDEEDEDSDKEPEHSDADTEKDKQKSRAKTPQTDLNETPCRAKAKPCIKPPVRTSSKEKSGQSSGSKVSECNACLKSRKCCCLETLRKM